MDWSGVGGSVGGIAAAVVLGWVLRHISGMKAPVEGNQSVLRYHKSYLVIAWTNIALFGGAAVAVQFAEESLRFRLTMAACFSLFALVGAVLLVFYHRCRLSWEGDDLESTGLIGRTVKFQWKDVAEVKFAPVSQWWILRLRDGNKVRVSTYMVGAINFMRELHRRTGLEMPQSVLTNGQKVELS